MSNSVIPGVVLSNGPTMYSGRQQMIVPAGGKSVRQSAFFLPGLVIATDTGTGLSTPVVTATIDSSTAKSGTPIMQIYQVDIVPSGAQTEIKVSAQSSNGTEIDGDYFCNVIVLGTPK